MRTVKLEKEISDVSGLFFELMQGEFEVLSVSAHERCTYINLETEEEKDPLPLAERFLSEPPKVPSRSSIEERREAYRKFLDDKPLRMANLRARYRVSQEIRAIALEAGMSQAQQPEAPVALIETQPQVLTMPPTKGDNWWTRLKRMF